jgi:hypothetical protein
MSMVSSFISRIYVDADDEPHELKIASTKSVRDGMSQ